MDTKDDVPVLSHSGQLVERVPPAVARFALKQLAATVAEQEPFTIRLAPNLDLCPRPARSFVGSRSSPEVVRGIARGRENMNLNYFNPAQSMLNVIDFFEKVDRKNGGDGIVWAKATAARGAQVIVELKTQNGQRVKIPAIRAGDPVCLSKFATFDVIRDSPDLTQSANNGLLKLLTHEQANEHFERKASRLKTSPQALMMKAEQSARASAFSKPLEVSAVDRTQRIEDTYVSEDEVVNPRIVHLCAQVDARLKDNQRMPVNELMSEILDLEDSMSLDDTEYLRAKGYYPTVRKWAEQKQHEIALREGLGAPTEDDLS